MTSRRIETGGERGFTLAEMLIAIVIFAAVVSMVYGAYNATFKVIAGGDANARYGERARVALVRMSEDLESLYLGADGTLKGESQSFGEYRGDSLSFTSTAHIVFNPRQPERGLALIGYTVEEDADSGLLRLYRADVPVLPGAAPPGAAPADDERGFLLCDGLSEVAITYVDGDGNEEESWDTAARAGAGSPVLPALVRLRLGFAGEKEDEPVVYTTAVSLVRGTFGP